jgi:hypothetical protein
LRLETFRLGSGGQIQKSLFERIWGEWGEFFFYEGNFLIIFSVSLSFKFILFHSLNILRLLLLNFRANRLIIPVMWANFASVEQINRFKKQNFLNQF